MREKRAKPPEGGRKKRVAPAGRRKASEADVPTRWIVGIGASAGGLEAFSQLLEALDRDTGMAFVLVQHLAPKHKSLLANLLAAKTTLPVLEARDGMPLRANHVFVIPPNAQITIETGKLHLSPRPQGPGQHLPINAFFSSLAKWSDGHSIGIVLSGTADDGAIGLREIKAVGGITIAQDPATARYEGMPRAAIATDVVDLVLSPAAIAAELNRIATLPLVSVNGKDAEESSSSAPSDSEDDHLRKVFHLLRMHSGVDFSQYKHSTILRRLNRRMVLNKASDVGRYVRTLDDNPGEVGNLFHDLLIHVTSFFRDLPSFEALQKAVLPKLLHKREGGAPLRMWVLGCSTGEEAYSLAICVLEAMEAARVAAPVQIFATDVSDSAIQQARAATYPESISAQVSPERLRRWFTRTNGSYRANRNLRDCCIFARHDVTRDPPFSKLELISCRNLLIYLGAPLQRRLIGMLHFALRPGGFMMLGSAETVGTQTDLFASVDKTSRIYVRRQTDGVVIPHDRASVPVHVRDERVALPAARVRLATTLSEEAGQLLLAHYAPAGVIADGDLRIVHFRGQTGAYLAPPPGEATLQLLKMLRGGLMHGARSALQEASKSGAPARRESLSIEGADSTRRVGVVVLPLTTAGRERHYLVLFEEGDSSATSGAAAGRGLRSGKMMKGASRTRDAKLVAKLQKELADSGEYLQSINQDLEATNEELQSANEEILSNNEELQSANEELDTAKEEMESANEELNTVNDELRARNEELSRVNSDLANLLASMQIAIVIIGSDLRIRRFTPMAESVLNLIPSDVGRPFTDIKPNIDLPEIGPLIHDVIDTMKVFERDVCDRQGRTYSLRIRPYKNLENRIDGAVIALFDVEAAVRGKEKARAALDLAEAVFATVRDPLVVLDANLRVERVNPAFCRAFGIDPTQAVGTLVGELAGARWMRPEVQRKLEQVFTVDRPFEDLEVEVEVEVDGAGSANRENRIKLNARRIERAGGAPGLLLLAGNVIPPSSP